MLPAKPIPNAVYSFVNIAVTLLILLVVFLWINWAGIPNGGGEFLAIRLTVSNLIVIALFLLAWAVAFRVFGFSKPLPSVPFWTEPLRASKVCTVAAVFALLFPLTSSSGTFSGWVLLYFLPTAIVACLCGRFAAKTFAVQLARVLRGHRDLIIVGSGPRAASLYERCREYGPHRARVLGFVDSPSGYVPCAKILRKMLGGLDELEKILMKRPVDEVLIALPLKSCYEHIQTAIKTCERAGVEAKYLADVFELSLATRSFESDDRAPLVSLKVVRDGYRLVVKRGIDIAGAIVGLVIFSPIMLAVAAAIKLSSPGPALFAQQRFGLHKRQFRMYKFRTMVQEAEKLQKNLESSNEAQGPVFKIHDDPRITSTGRFLRRKSLDELPQLFNVLLGEMSLVGPRPLPQRDVARFEDASLMRRFSVKPGLTCLWQVNGRSNTDFDRWIAFDLEYIDKWSLTLDLKILMKTVPAVLAGKGAA